MKKQIMAVAAALAVLTSVPAFSVFAEGDMLYEAEDAVIIGTLKIFDDSDASGGRAIGNFSEDNDAITFTADIPR